MRTITQPLLAMTARDLMTTNVVTIPMAMSLQAAAHRLSQASISGAPVVDVEGRLVGVLSATDFVAWTERGDRAAQRDNPDTECAYSAWQVMDTQVLPHDEVSRFMTADPVTVTPATPIVELARKMLDAHIHRVIVIDELDRPIGVVSSTDVLAAVAYADKSHTTERRW
jgi:CBS domain-containing protein